MRLLCLFCVGLLWFGGAVGYPAKNGYKAIPKRAVMFSGYYSNPLFSRNFDYTPQGSMSAVVTRDTVSTNTYSGPQPHQYPPIGELPLEENETVEKYTEKSETLPYSPPQVAYAPPQESYPAPELPSEPVEAAPEAPSAEVNPAVAVEQVPLVEDVAIPEEVSTEPAVVTRGPSRAPKKQATKKPAKEEEEEDDGGLPAYWPFGSSKGSVPSYNAFFPIHISGGGAPSRRRSGNEDDGYYPGAATAIANSFSTGKGGHSDEPRDLLRRPLHVGADAEGPAELRQVQAAACRRLDRRSGVDNLFYLDGL
ncbi:hypothetical protein NQ318_001915 [Aromia moschata]|uniref:DUF4794 domain-containing protein n=1 Tax=Aromia moschata TaxID=1265417 RepID=A0AAV8Z3I7_9CUCU|nr:hypothetical protein NQ318_001915 [Aromia moschata]